MPRRRGRSVLLAALCVIAVCAACTTHGSTPTSDPVSTTSSTPSTSTPETSPMTTPPKSPTSADPPPRPHTAHLHPRPDQLTPQGLWWAVDSVAPIDATTLANVREWYRGAPRPLAWGRYITGGFGLRRAELGFARRHHIAVLVIVPDRDCSICAGGGDVCGQDHTAAQAQVDARAALRAARRLGLPSGTTLFKDIEQVGSCYGELTAHYLLAWRRYVDRTRYVAGFYGNTFRQGWDFPRAYCAALRIDPTLRVQLAQDEPEPQIGSASGEIGPANAPRFAPSFPHCATPRSVRIWQYGESGSSADLTDADEIRPGTHGLIAPDGRVT